MTDCKNVIVITKEKNRRIQKEEEHPNEVWRRCVEQSKLLIMGRNMARTKLCELCLEACNIVTGGGGHWSEFKDQYHIGAFADEIGVNRKTLGNWMVTYRFVIMKLPTEKRLQFNWSTGERVRKEVKAKASTSVERIEKAYKKIANETPEEKMNLKITSYAKSIRSNIPKMNMTNKQKTVIELKSILKELNQ